MQIIHNLREDSHYLLKPFRPYIYHLVKLFSRKQLFYIWLIRKSIKRLF